MWFILETSQEAKILSIQLTANPFFSDSMGNTRRIFLFAGNDTIPFPLKFHRSFAPKLTLSLSMDILTSLKRTTSQIALRY